MKNLLYIALLFFTLTSYATQYTWVGGESNWSDSTNWSPVGLPGIEDTVRIIGLRENIEMDTSVTISCLIWNAGNSVARTSRISGSDTLTVSDHVQWDRGRLGGGNLVINGILDIDDSSVPAWMDSNSYLELNDTTNQINGRIVMAGASVVNNGVFRMKEGNGVFLNIGNGGTATFKNKGYFINERSGGIIGIDRLGEFLNDTIGVFRNLYDGEIGIRADFINRGRIESTGTIRFDFDFVQNGAIAPSPFEDSLSINKLNNTSGIIEIEIESSLGPGVGHDILNISGSAQIGGILNVSLINNYEPLIGQRFKIITCPDGCEDFFAAINVPNLLNDKEWNIDYFPGSIELSVIAPPEKYAFYSISVINYSGYSIINGCGNDCGNPFNDNDISIDLRLNVYNSNNIRINSDIFRNEWSESCYGLLPNLPQGTSGFSDQDSFRIELSLNGRERDDGLFCDEDDGVCGGFAVVDTIYPLDYSNNICGLDTVIITRQCDNFVYSAVLKFTYWYEFLRAGEVGISQSIFESRNDLFNSLNLETYDGVPATPNSTFEWEILEDDVWKNTGLTDQNAKLIAYLVDETAALGSYTFRRKAFNDELNDCTLSETAYSNLINISITDECEVIYLNEDFESNEISSPPFVRGGNLDNLWQTQPNGTNLSNYCAQTGYMDQPTDTIINYLQTTVDIPISQRVGVVKFDIRHNMTGFCRLLIDGVIIDEYVGESDAWQVYEYEFPTGIHTIRWEYRKLPTDVFNENEAVQLDNIIIYERHPDFAPLLSLFYGTDGDVSWINRSGWEDRFMPVINCDPCTWYGVTCDTSERVVSLELPNNNITGGLPYEMMGLILLDTLNLSGNNLNSGFNEWITDLENLRVLDLSDNDLTGSLMNWIGDFSSLQQLNLSNNAISGALPPEVGNLDSLKQLLIADNQLTDNLPSQLSQLTNLILLEINNNDLSGCYPTEIGVLCSQLGVESTNANISDGNNFDATWEDFCLLAAGTCDVECPQTLNLTMNPIQDSIYQASDSIVSTVQIVGLPSRDITYKAGEVILLQVGFEVENGNTFQALIEDCNMNLTEPVIESRVQLAKSANNIKAYPNPFSTATTIEYELSETSEVEFHILDVTGRLVETLIPNQQQAKGKYRTEWLPKQQRTGVYLLRARIGEEWKIQKLMLIE